MQLNCFSMMQKNNYISNHSMKKALLTLFALTFTLLAVSQNYEIERLKVISKIWGEAYLFHPSIVRADKSVEWEKCLVDFLPQIKKELTDWNTDAGTSNNPKKLRSVFCDAYKFMSPPACSKAAQNKMMSK